MPEARVFRPRSEKEDNLIDKLLEIRAKQGVIKKPSWTLYTAYLINRDVADIRKEFKDRTR